MTRRAGLPYDVIYPMTSTRPSTFILLVLALAAPRGAAAVEPAFIFEKGDQSVIDDRGQAWHSEHEKSGDYGESWFTIVHTRDGGVLFTLFSITNLGLSTFDGICNANFYAPDGKVYYLHEEYDRDDLRAATDKLDATIGKNRIWAVPGGLRIQFNEKGLSLDLTLARKLPPHQFGNGRIQFYADRSAEWAWGISVPRAETTGRLEAGGKRYDLAGFGYSDHGWSTIKMPSFVSRWLTLRLLNAKYAVILHQQQLSSKFGGRTVSFGLLGTEEKLLGAMRRFTYEPRAWRQDDKSGYRIPTELEVDLTAGGYTVRGTVKEERFLDSLDVLGQVSWPVRTVIKVLYSKPYLIRYLGRYELDVIGPDGTTEHLSGLAPVEANYY